MWRGLRDRRYFRHVGERFGFLPDSIPTTSRDAIWLHAVSVGEVISSTGLVQALRAAIPGVRLYVSCTTLAGRDVADQKLRPITDGIFYAPFDFVWVIRRILRRLQPRLVIVMETEIWPNLWREAKRSGAGLLVVNGRISDRAYPRYQEFRWFFTTVFGLADRILVQSEVDRQRYAALGARPEIGGNLKYDFDPRSAEAAPEVRAWCKAASQRWIAASTMPPAIETDPDEDDCVLAAWEKLRRPGLRMVLVPRRPERFDLAAEKLKARGIDFVRRSALRGDEPEDVLLLDTIGELSGLFRFADVVFMGGTLASRGGHNVLEPAAFGKPVIVGPHMENFRAITDRFLSAGALIEIGGQAELAPAVDRVLRGYSAKTGERARVMAEAERGATDRAVGLACEMFDGSRPHHVAYGPLRPWLWLVSLAWQAGVFLDRTFTRRHRLSTPVVSVGGLAMGGSGKTPLVRWLARQLSERGYEVAILIRGYRRAAGPPVVLAKGSRAPIEITGDEGQLHLRDGFAHLGIGADRYQVGRLLEIELKPDVFLLDDGFQHWRLERDVDIVVLDGVDELFPLGRAREPESALARADLVLEKRLEVRGWCPPLPEGGRIGAFCAIGDPESFRRTLASAGVTAAEWWVYPDHHAYSERELRKMSTQADVLVTTEKDYVKLPPGFAAHYLLVEFDGPSGRPVADRIESCLLRKANR